jgi:CubicO group peptidase (beta-lactamase class C family)
MLMVSMLPPFLLALMLAVPVPRFEDPARRQKLEAAFPEIDGLFERFWKSRNAPGLAYGIIIDGQLVHLKTFGVQDVTSQAPVTPNTVFRIASMTKSFTALAVLKLRDEGKLSLEDPVSRWIPEFARMPLPTVDSPPIRVRDLLTHSAGFPEDNPWGDQQLGITEETLDSWLKEGIPFSTTPGTAYEYSNYGFALAGRIVSKASGVPFRDYLEKQILAPLGMRSSTLEPSAVPAATRAIGYRRMRDGRYEVEPSLPHGAFGAMGGLLTSPGDLARYVAFQLAAFPPRDETGNDPVRRSSLREMQQMWRHGDLTAFAATGNAPLAVNSIGYGYGLRIWRDCRFAHIVGHGGGLPGFGSYMMWLPEYGVGMFAMANVTYAGPASPMNQAFDVLRRTGALKPRALAPAPVLTSTRDAIFALWKDWSDSKARALAAGNLFVDVPERERRAQRDLIRARVGACTSVTGVEPENLLRGSFRMICERGEVRTTFTLAPTQPPLVQHLSFAENPQEDKNVCRP